MKFEATRFLTQQITTPQKQGFCIYTFSASFSSFILENGNKTQHQQSLTLSGKFLYWLLLALTNAKIILRSQNAAI
jgi:hypothetical protein